MDAHDFVRKWAAVTANESQTKQSHFNDLCGLLGQQTPIEADPAGDWYAFEKGAKGKDGDGFADVWLHKHFAWEYKGKKKDLIAAYGQVLRYHEALQQPPLLVVCDIDRYEVHTKWTNTESWVYKFNNADIAADDRVEVTTGGGTAAKDAPELTARQVLKALFENVEVLKPGRTREQVTREAADLFRGISEALRNNGTDPDEAARFITRLVFCMFASDVDLLPRQTFSEVIKANNPDRRRQEGAERRDPAPAFRRHLSALFEKMRTGGELHVYDVPYFNGRLFDDDSVPDGLTAHEIRTFELLDDLDWADVEPAIFGTLFEAVIDPKERKPLGLHYTSRDDIELIVQPVLMDPLKAEWQRVQEAIKEATEPRSGRKVSEARQQEKVKELASGFLKRLSSVRVLDPACGSGNFLYVSLALLKALEKEVLALAESFKVKLKPRVHPRQLHGIEINEYAHELAGIVIWIGYLQWKKANGYSLTDERPILQPLDQIERRDAIVDATDAGHPREATWPNADVIVGNPPFLGGKQLRTGLGDEYVERMFAVYEGRVARESDLCCYWFEKARAQIEAGKAKRAGLLATQAIRGGANRKVLERIKETGDIFYAQADRPWVLNGAAVRVSMVGFDDGSEERRLLNEETEGDARTALLRSRAVEAINSNLTAAKANVTAARRLKENVGICFQGPVVVGPFYLESALARKMLNQPNPHGLPNSDVIHRFVNGNELVKRPGSRYIIDFGQRTAEEAALYEAPFEYVKRIVKPFREKSRDSQRRTYWWRHGRAGTDLRAAAAALNRIIATPEVAKHRVFVWLDADIRSANTTELFARSDDYFFGVLQSRVHEVWALLTGTQLENRPRYTPTTCFETFPFPRGTQEQQWAISIAAKDLNEMRENWLHPNEMVGAKELARRTLTELYNKKPQWLVDAHRTLDEVAFAAYGWREAVDALSDEEIVARLLKLNLEREPAG